MKLVEFAENTFDRATKFSITGHLISDGPDDFVILQPCFCVHDSPDHPCPCPDIFKVWVPRRSVIGKVEALEQKSKEGELLHRVYVNRKEDLMIDATVSFNFAEVSQLMHSLPKPISNPLGPVLTGPTMPVPPEEDEPGTAHFIGGLIVGLGKKYGATIAGTIGGYILAEIFDDSSCKTTETTEEYVNENGKKVTKTVTIRECD